MRLWELEQDPGLEGLGVRAPLSQQAGSPPLPAFSPHPHSSPSSLSSSAGPLSGAPEGLCPGHAGPPGDSGNFSIQHFLWERWAEGHWKLAFRALGPCPALEAEEGSLTVAKGRVIFNSFDMGSVQKCG